MNKIFLSPLLLAGVFSLLYTPAHATFLHAPHDDAHGVDCVDCHEFSLEDASAWGAPQATTDETVKNFICLKCHGPGGSAPTKAMHSDLTINGSEMWTTECTDCHAPHFQRQIAGVADISEDFLLSDMYLVTGTINSITSAGANTTIAYSLGNADAKWTNPASWSAKTGTGRGLIFVADAASPNGQTFETLAANGFSITVIGTVDPAMVGKTFGLLYGQFLKNKITTNLGDQVVSFYNPYGGFVDKSGSVAPTGICQVCHENTIYWTNDGANINHNGDAKCVGCHSHDTGFAPSGGGDTGKHPEHLALTGVTCDSCHDIIDFPYFKSGTDANGDGKFELFETDVCTNCHNDGTGNPVTGFIAGWTDPEFELTCASCHALSPGSGSHDFHLTIIGCGRCHDGTIEGTTPPEQHIDNTIDVYDVIPGDLGYPADKAKSSPYSNCSNFYCHSNGTSVQTGVVEPFTSATWGSGPLACDSCHGFAPDYPNGSPKANSHQVHGTNNCQFCHAATTTTGNTITDPANHANGNYDILAGDGVSFSYAAGTCSNISCHQGGSADWGSTTLAFDCDSCHGYPPVPGDGLNVNDLYDGGKGAHVTQWQQYDLYGIGGHILSSDSLQATTDRYGDITTGYNECAKCHMDGLHGNGKIDIKIMESSWSTTTNKGYYERPYGFGLGPPIYDGVPGEAVSPKTCSNIICHQGKETPKWSCPGGE